MDLLIPIHTYSYPANLDELSRFGDGLAALLHMARAARPYL